MEFDCDSCKKKFTHKRNLKRHIIQKHLEPKKQSREQQFSCFMCNKTFSSPSHLQRHQLAKLSAREHKCPICNKEFNQKVHLKTHLTRVHNPSESDPSSSGHSCTRCTKSFPTNWELKRHENRVHSTELSCHECGGRFFFQTLKEWKSHSAYHLGKKPFLCDVCGLAFGQGQDLRSHQDAKHKNQGSFQCSICQEVFVQRRQVDYHLKKVHKVKKITTFDCDLCDEKISEEVLLKKHLFENHSYLPDAITVCKCCNMVFRNALACLIHTEKEHFRKLNHPLRLGSPAQNRPYIFDSSELTSETSTGEPSLNLIIKISPKISEITDRLVVGPRIPEEYLKLNPSLRSLEILLKQKFKPGENFAFNIPLDNSSFISKPLEIFYK